MTAPMTAPLTGYRGRDAVARAQSLARTVSTDPRTWELADGSRVAVGETLLASDGSRDRVLYGVRGTHALASEARAAGLLPE